MPTPKIPIAGLPYAEKVVEYGTLNLSEIIQQCHATAVEHGWWEDIDDPADPREILSKIALMHSELSEALECVRDTDLDLLDGVVFEGPEKKPHGFVIEFADCIIRIFDLLGALRLEDLMVSGLPLKMAFNDTRPYKHGGKNA